MAKYAKILDIRIVDTKKGPKAKIQLGKDVEIFFEGKKVDLGEYNSVFLEKKEERIEFLQRMVDEGKMKQENVDREVAYLQDKGVSSLVQVKLED